MAHELTIRESGKVEMAYAKGVQPWHGLGTPVEVNSPLEVWLEASGMDWSVGRSPVFYQFGDQQLEAKNRNVLHRSDTGEVLGIVSKDYHIVQPMDVMDFFRSVISGFGLEMVSAGTLFGGSRFWATAYIGEDSLVDNRDVVKGYLLLSTSADGSLATTARYTTTRVVCNNTLRIANAGGMQSVKIIHKAEFNPDEMKAALGLAPRSFETFMDNLKALANVPVGPQLAEDLTTTLMGRHGIAMERGGKRVMELFNGEAIGSGLSGVSGTAWGWLNAVTEYIDHDRQGKTESHRLNNLLFGTGDALKTAAHALAAELV